MNDKNWLENREADEDEGFWGTLEVKVAQVEDTPMPDKEDLWVLLEDRINPNRWRPNRRPDVEILPDSFAEEGGPKFYIIKCSAARVYLRVNEKQLFVWNNIDGDNTVRDLISAYRDHFNGAIMPFTLMTQILTTFKTKNLLIDANSEELFDKLNKKVKNDVAKRGVAKVLGMLMKTRLPLHNVDRKVTAIYHKGGKLIFKPFIWLPLLLIGLFGVGLGLFTIITGHSIPKELVKSEVSGVTYMILAYAFMLPLLFAHELMHALMVKHYGREVLGGGLLLIRTMPGLYVDTTDIWLDRNKWHRILVSIVGPMANLVAAGILFIVSLQIPIGFLSAFFFALALNNLMVAFFNLNPLVELDGYYAIIDLINERALRAKSIRMLFSLRFRWKEIPKFTKREFFYLVYGIVALCYTVLLLGGFGLFILRFVLSTPGLILTVVLSTYYVIMKTWKWNKARRYANLLERKLEQAGS